MIFVTRINARTGIKERSFFKNMKKKFVLPLAALGLMVALAGCKEGGTDTSTASGSGTPGTSATASASSSKMEQIKITTATGSKSLVVGTTLQLTADQEGVTWSTANADIATVSAAGLVEAKALGSVKITAKKDGFKDGTVTLEITRPAATAKIDWKDADHYSVDGSYTRSNRGPGETPVYTKSQAEDGECIGYQGTGDKETLTFTSTAAVAAELTSSMGSNSSVNLADVWKIKLNGTELNLAGKRYESDDSSGNYTFQEVSFGDVNLIQGDNVLEIEYLVDDSPYLDNFYVYAKGATTITSKPAAAKPQIEIADANKEVTVAAGSTVQLVVATEGVSYTSSNEGVATVSDTGLVTGVTKGTATITVRKDGYLSNKITVNVTLSASTILIEAETSENLVEYADDNTVAAKKSSGSSYVSGGYYVRSLPTGSVLTYTFAATNPGSYNMVMSGRNFNNSHTIEDLSQDCEIKLNNVAINVAGKAWAYNTSANNDVNLGAVTLAASNTLTFTVTGAETPYSSFMLDCFTFVPAA